MSLNLLFTNLYEPCMINDITVNITCDIRSFVDDTSILEIVHDPTAIAESLSSNLVQILRWGKLWRMTFNAIKSNSMTSSAKRHRPNLGSYAFKQFVMAPTYNTHCQ